jgi:hypothetical protein
MSAVQPFDYLKDVPVDVWRMIIAWMRDIKQEARTRRVCRLFRDALPRWPHMPHPRGLAVYRWPYARKWWFSTRLHQRTVTI